MCDVVCVSKTKIERKKGALHVAYYQPSGDREHEEPEDQNGAIFREEKK